MSIPSITLLLFLSLTSLHLFGQAQVNYLPPMDIPLILAGNFGEMRNNHFHTGIDIKTQGKQGIPLHSIADGYISRIKVSPYGYGNALYVDHPDGHTSVYAHMRSFNDSIESFTRKAQYELEDWAIEYYPEPGDLPVKQGEIIGLSGNSGSSSGPHLHFEIRETLSEHPLNPLNFGLDVKDDLAPIIKGIRAYPLDGGSHVDGGESALSYVALQNKGDDYSIAKSIHVNGTIGLAIHTYDRMSLTSNKYGIYRLEMLVDDELHYSHVMDELDFDNFRQVNCHKDYDLYYENRWRYHKCFPAENNTLAIYDWLVDNGRVRVAEGDTLAVRFKAYDIEGNSSELSCTLIGSPALTQDWPTQSGVKMTASTDNVYIDTGLVVRIPQGRIYEDFYLRPSREMIANGLSDQFCLHDHDVPMDDKIKVSIRAKENMTGPDHVIMEHSDQRGRKKYLATSSYEGWFESENRSLGCYRLLTDNSPPQLKVTGLTSNGKNDAVNLSLSDNLSGVVEFSVYVDDQWLLMAYNASMSRAWGHLSDLDLAPGEHTMRLYAKDLAGNVKEERISFNY